MFKRFALRPILLPRWTYLVLTILLLLLPIQKLQLDGAVRARVAVITGLAVLGYFVLVYFFSSIRPLTRTTSGASRDVILLSHSRWRRCSLPR
jgi:hypothetical protein